MGPTHGTTRVFSLTPLPAMVSSQMGLGKKLPPSRPKQACSRGCLRPFCADIPPACCSLPTSLSKTRPHGPGPFPGYLASVVLLSLPFAILSPCICSDYNTPACDNFLNMLFGHVFFSPTGHKLPTSSSTFLLQAKHQHTFFIT